MKKIDKKQMIIVTLIITVAIIFVPVYFYVLADDSDANKVEIKSSSVASVTDGSLPFDSETGSGMDVGDNNGIVRTFDSMTYTLNYSLGAKDGETITGTERSIIVDVLLPVAVTGRVSVGTTDIVDLNGQIIISPDNCYETMGNIVFNGKYRYAEFTIGDQTISSDGLSLNVTISDIYSENNTEFEPIFIIKESTDSNTKSLGELSCNELSDEFESVRSELNVISNCENIISEVNSCSTTVTGVDNYSIRLLTGEMDESVADYEKKYPIGVSLALNSSGEKGIRGSLIPSEVDINFSIIDSATSTEVDLSPEGYKPYVRKDSQNPKEYRIYTDGSIELAELNNGTVTSASAYNMHISNIEPDNVLNNIYNGSYTFSTNAFVITYNRDSYDYANKNFVITGATALSSSNISITNNYDFNLGKYSSKVDLYNTLESDPEAYGVANFNYNQDFYIKDTFMYTSTGDGLTDLTNYLKIDNDAVDITLNDDNMDYKFDNSDSTSPNRLSEVKFGYAEWNSNFFEVTGVENCPFSIDELNREQIMNLYGGPCIREKTDMVKWVSTLDDPSLDDGERQRGPILVKTVLTGDSSRNDLIFPGLNATIELKAKIKDSYMLNNRTYQIVTSAIAYGSGNIKYLGDGDGTGLIMERNNFIKSEFSDGNIVTNRNLCSTELCGVSGDTILVSGVKVSKPTVRFYRNNKETSNFYYYPIETRISDSAIKNDMSAGFEKADIYVDMPSYMEYIEYDNSDTAKSPTDVTPITINDTSYNRYHYVFERDEIINGDINNLKVFTNISMDTPNGITPTIYVTADYTISKTIYDAEDHGTLVYMSSIMPVEYRRTVDSSITIYNGANITTQGVNAPTNMEKNGSYTYKMRAYNNSRSNGNLLSYPNASLYYVIPYDGDSSYSDLSSDYEATGFKIKLNEALPAGYTAYYTEDLASNIINEEIANTGTIQWTEWNNPTTEKANITGIKITKTDNFEPDTYFIKNDGITITIAPINSEEGDLYYNSFYIITDKPSNYECDEDDESCSTTDSKRLYYSSSRTLTSIYNRKISGFVFEDYDESGIYSQDESKLENIPVSLYRIEGDISTIDPKDPTTFVSEDDTLIAESVTSSNGEYHFRGVSKGNYYVKFKYNDSHYTPTDNSVINPNIPDSASNNSKASILPNTDIAISNLITFSGNTTEYNSMNLGLKIKKEFKVEIKKYITNIQVISEGKTENFNYNNATRVTLNVKNPKNAKVRVRYSFYVENVKYYPGYVGMIVDSMPEGMTFNPNIRENQDWVYYDNNLYYNGLSGAILLPNQKIPFGLVLEADLSKGGNYVNTVSVKDLTLMGDELPRYDFNSLGVNGGGE